VRRVTRLSPRCRARGGGREEPPRAAPADRGEPFRTLELAARALQIDVKPPRQMEPESVQIVRALEDEERRGAQQLRDLAHRERTRETALPCLLLETMAMDSDKHAHLLAFVAEHLGRRKSSR